MLYGHVSLIVYLMTHIPRLKEVIPRAVNNGFVRHDICHIARGDEANARTNVIMLANMSSRL